MYQTHKTYIKPGTVMLELINENPSLLLLMEHFDMDYCVNEKTVQQICSEYNISLSLFLIIGNLYNGFYPNKEEINMVEDLAGIIKFLKNSHNFYKNDKYPEIKRYLATLKDNQNTKDIQLIEEFFNSYFKEVIEHLDYEDKTAFPYFYQLIQFQNRKSDNNFSANEYREHHTDIETKLNDLKNLLLNHIALKGNLTIRRKFLSSLLELEFDLQIHSIVEEKVLLPLVSKIENNLKNG
jgi:regulator of cell morphogenesis and NO signaling